MESFRVWMAALILGLSMIICGLIESSTIVTVAGMSVLSVFILIELVICLATLCTFLIRIAIRFLQRMYHNWIMQIGDGEGSGL